MTNLCKVNIIGTASRIKKGTINFLKYMNNLIIFQKNIFKEKREKIECRYNRYSKEKGHKFILKYFKRFSKEKGQKFT